MPNLGSPLLNLILDIAVTFWPYIVLAVATFAAGMWGWSQRQNGKVTWQQVKAEAASEAVAAAEQAVAQADKDGKFQFAKTLLEAKVGKLGATEAVSLIEAAVLRLHVGLPGSQAAQQTSASAQPILAKIAAPTTSQRLGAEGEAILRAVRADLVTVKRDAAEAKARAAAAEAALRTPQATAARTTRTASSGKDAPVTLTPPIGVQTSGLVATTPAAPTEAPAAATPPAPAQP